MYPLRFILLFSLFFVAIIAHAQDRTCYDRLRQLGINDYNAGKKEAAIKKWEAAKDCSFVPADNDLNSWIQKARNPAPVVKTNEWEPEMILVEGSTFIMGCKDGRDSNCSDDEKPPHAVTVKDFYIGKYEVTLAQFKAFVDATAYQTDADKNGSSYIWTGSEWKDTKGVNWLCDVGGSIRPKSEYNHPVIHVSWNDAVAYAKWLAGKTGKKYRLPSEAEWEYAARGGDKSNGYTYAGSNTIDDVAWYTTNAGGKTHSVGQKKANELGIYDMSGNVWEWVQDCYNDTYAGAPSNGTAWTSDECDRRVLRGGSWINFDLNCRVANRVRNLPDFRNDNLGFRLAQDQ